MSTRPAPASPPAPVGLAVTAAAVALPGVTRPAGLLAPVRAAADPVDPTVLIGKKGLRFADRATRIGLHLACAALREAGLLATVAPGTPARVTAGARTGIVVSSNLGNADTVCHAVETIAKEGTRGLSPMATPNASSNIVASETAIRYGLRGPNLTVCNGPSSGLDALRWATLLLRAGRADHMLVLGVEPDNEVTRRLVDGPVADGGAALVLSTAPTAPVQALLGPVGPAASGDGGAGAAGGPPQIRSAGLRLGESGPEPALDAWGELSGALGVVQAVAATAWLAGRGPGEPAAAYARIGAVTAALTTAGAGVGPGEAPGEAA
ncbi:beta-ketoacyl synthase N-terminal-like domain-containing protein [Streptomyces sp. CB03234]|uniref:beta-ketoacyl synthase N-terminal-like domain-containing protein n=1 Tax=Streptomyces sp. (strain CB03234) TaxID=1703937 RepID=UPI00093FBEFB|nr:beta-ketoacyl synthase N-terminal-like domain-containing protein [Streptomyces sp. CB03234]